MPLQNNSVTRHIDPQGDEIKAFLDDDGSFVQAVAIVDENGNQIAISGNPIVVTTVSSQPVATTIVDQFNNQSGLSSNPFFIRSEDNRHTTFEELVVANRYNIINVNPNWSVSRLRDSTTALNDSSITVSGGEIKLSSGTAINNITRIQTLQRGEYQPGTEAEWGIGVRIPQSLGVSQNAKWGYFDDENGMGYGISGSDLYVFTRSNSADTVVYQSDWNEDVADGSGKSGYNLNIAEGNVFQCLFTWYGYGSIKFVIANVRGTYTDTDVVPIHTFSITGQTSIADPNQPLRVEINNSNSVSADNSDLYVGGRQYSIITSHYSPDSRDYSQPTYITLTADQNVWQPIIAIREKPTFVGDSNSVRTFLTGIDVTSNQDVEIKVEFDTGVTGTYFNPTDMPLTETAVEALTGNFLASGGIPVIRQNLVAVGGNKNQSSATLEVNKRTPLSPENDAVLYVRRRTSNSTDITAYMTWTEEW